MYDLCEYCPYASQYIDSIGHSYYVCELDDDPDNYLGAVCCHCDDDLK